jgi:hypothetical protein
MYGGHQSIPHACITGGQFHLITVTAAEGNGTETTPVQTPAESTQAPTQAESAPEPGTSVKRGEK